MSWTGLFVSTQNIQNFFEYPSKWQKNLGELLLKKEDALSTSISSDLPIVGNEVIKPFTLENFEKQGWRAILWTMGERKNPTAWGKEGCTGRALISQNR